MLGYILLAIVSFYLGFRFGVRAKLKMLESKEQKIANLMTELKNTNNEMLRNFSKVAHTTSNTEGQWTEVDDFLMPMWME